MILMRVAVPFTKGLRQMWNTSDPMNYPDRDREAIHKPGLLDMVEAAMAGDELDSDKARAAVEAHAAWLDYMKVDSSVGGLLRAEIAPPRPTPEDVIRGLIKGWQGTPEAWISAIVAALRDAGFLKEGTP